MRVREGSFPSLPEPRRRSEHALLAVVQQAYVEGVSTRRVEDLVQALGYEGNLQEPGLAHLQVRLSYRARAVPLEPLLGVHPYLTSDGFHRRSGACSQAEMSDARQPTERVPRRIGGGKVPSATLA